MRRVQSVKLFRLSACTSRKLPPSGEELILQVMTKDDYDTNLGLVVHEIWWGHKDTMPGLP